MPALASLVAFALMGYCLVDIALTPASAVRGLPRLPWAFVVLFVPLIGSLAWLLVGRPFESGLAPGSSARRSHPAGRDGGSTDARTRGGRRHGGQPGGGQAPRERPRGPDDDPEFLREIEEQLRRGRRDEGDDGG